MVYVIEIPSNHAGLYVFFMLHDSKPINYADFLRFLLYDFCQGDCFCKHSNISVSLLRFTS